MDKKFLTKLLKSLGERLAGKNANAIIELLVGKKDVNEFKIAEKTGLTINQVRNVLYKLAHHNLISAIRKKDKRKGWYIYYWTLDSIRALELLIEMIDKEIKRIEHEIKKRETKSFYVCPICETEFSEETALLYEFTCPECGEVLQLVDSQKYLKELKKRATTLEQEIIEVRKIRDELMEEKKKRETKKKAARQKKKERKKKTAGKKKTMKKSAARGKRKRSGKKKKESRKRKK